MVAVAIYARYSSDKQREASIEDQVRLCEERAAYEGWSVAQRYTDHGISGASLMRPGIQALLRDAMDGRFQVVLTEALDRLSRDQEDIARVHKRLRFAGAKIVTLSEGEIAELQIGFKGTMSALYLKDLADKTRRGLRGRVEAGLSGGGNSYGYDVVVKFAANGEPERGERKINEAQAATVRHIFNEYASGKSPKAIALALNRANVPGPSGKGWGPSTINGNGGVGPASSIMSFMSGSSSGTGSPTSRTRIPVTASPGPILSLLGSSRRSPICGSSISRFGTA